MAVTKYLDKTGLNYLWSKIKAWCKHYDINPEDYSKNFLFRALKKRWEFEYGD